MGICLSKPKDELSELSTVNVNLDDVYSLSEDSSDFELIKLCSKVMDHAKFNLHRLEEYKGSSDKIRMAIMNPDSDVESHAWKAIRPIVHILGDCYLTAMMIEDLFSVILYRLSQPSVIEGIENHGTILAIAANILLYIYSFDSCKMSNPDIQNDFSYYRRTMNRKKLYGHATSKDAIVSEDMANRMSMFFANPSPLRSCIVQKLSNPTKKHFNTSKLCSSLVNGTRSIYFTSNLSNDHGISIQDDTKSIDLQKENLDAMTEYFSQSTNLEDGDTLTTVFKAVATWLKSLNRNKSNSSIITVESSLETLSSIGFVCMSQAQISVESTQSSKDRDNNYKLLSISTMCILICDSIYSENDHNIPMNRSFHNRVKDLLYTIRTRLSPNKGNTLLSFIKYSRSYRKGVASKATMKLLEEYH